MEAQVRRMTPATGRPAGRRGSRPRGRLASLVIVAVTGVGLLGLAYLSNRPASASRVTAVGRFGSPTLPAPIVGQMATPISGTTLDGSPFAIADLVGSPVWLSFGAAWGPPGRAARPAHAAPRR